MVHVALWVPLEAKPGKEAEVEKFLISARDLVGEEPATVSWYAIRMGPGQYGIFDSFPSEEGRKAHLTGKVAAALMAKAPDLFAKPPQIFQLDVLSAKLP